MKDIQKIISKIETSDMDGWHCEKETVLLMSELISFFGATNFLEIGTYKGYTSLNILYMHPKINVTTIDIYNHFSGIYKSLRSSYKQRLSYKISDSAILNKYKPESFDFVFIDADHHLLPCIKDMLNIIPVIKMNCVVCVHDSLSFMGVKRFITLVKYLNLLFANIFFQVINFPTPKIPKRAVSGISVIFFSDMTYKKKVLLRNALIFVFYAIHFFNKIAHFFYGKSNKAGSSTHIPKSVRAL